MRLRVGQHARVFSESNATGPLSDSVIYVPRYAKSECLCVLGPELCVYVNADRVREIKRKGEGP